MEMYQGKEAPVAINNISSPDKSGSSILQYDGCSCSKLQQHACLKMHRNPAYVNTVSII